MIRKEQRSIATNLAIYAAPCLVGVFLVFSPTLLSGFRLMQTDLGDTRFLNYMLEHSFQWVTGNSLHSSFWSPPFFWPARNVAAYSEILLGVAPIYWVVRIFGFMPDTSFQLWMILATVLNYCAALFLLRSTLGISLIGSLGGSYLFAFAGARVAQISHQHLLPQFYSLAAIIFLINGFRAWENGGGSRQVMPWLLAFTGAVVLQFYSCVYHGWFFVFGLAVFALICCLRTTTRQSVVRFVKSNKLPIAGATLLATIALSWMGYHYFLAYRDLGPRGWPEVALMIPRLKSWLYFGDSPIYSWMGSVIDFSSLPMPWEHVLGLGFVTLLTCGYGYVRYAGKNPWLLMLGISGLAIVFIALLYPHGLSPWKLVYAVVPGASVIRAVTRIVLLVLIPVSVGVALGLQGIRSQKVAVAVLAGLCLEQWYPTTSFDKLVVRQEVAKISGSLSPECNCFYHAAVLPCGSEPPALNRHLNAMWAGIIAGRPTINGYTGNIPKHYWPLWDVVVDSQMRAEQTEERVSQWAKLSNLKLDGICLPWLREAGKLPVFCPQVNVGPDGNLSLEFGTALTRACLDSGWHADQSGHVWAGGMVANMCVPLEKDNGYEVELTVMPLVVPGKTQRLRISWNGSAVKEFELQPKLTAYRFDVSGDMVKDLNRIVFEFAYTDWPLRLGKSTDSRQLSVDFYKIAFLKRGPSSSLSTGPEIPVTRRVDLRGQPPPFGWEGFSGPESSGTWTEGTEAMLAFRFDRPVTSDLQLVIEGRCLVNEKHQQRLIIQVNGQTLSEMTLSAQSPSPGPVIIPRALVGETGILKVTLGTPDAITPKELGINEDSRRLGISIKSVVIKPLGGTGAQTD